MKVVMTQTELDRCIKEHDRYHGDDCLVQPDKGAPSGWSVYVRMNHWDKSIPIIVEGK